MTGDKPYVVREYTFDEVQSEIARIEREDAALQAELDEAGTERERRAVMRRYVARRKADGRQNV